MCLQANSWYISSVLIFSIHFFLFPDDPTYAYNILTKYLANCPILKHLTYYFYALLNFYFVAKMSFTFSFMVDFLHLSFFILAPFLKEIRWGKGKYKTSGNLRESKNVTKYYRSLQLLFKHYTEALGLLNIVCHVLMLKFSVFVQLSLIVQWDILSEWMRYTLVASLVGANLIWLCSIDVLGRLVTESGKCVRSWGKIAGILNSKNAKEDALIMGKFRKSCKPLMITFRSFYCIRRETVLGFLKMTNRLTFRSLLSVRKR